MYFIRFGTASRHASGYSLSSPVVTRCLLHRASEALFHSSSLQRLLFLMNATLCIVCCSVTFYLLILSCFNSGLSVFLPRLELHAMQTRSSDENSVRLSVKRMHCDKTEERSVQIFIP